METSNLASGRYPALATASFLARIDYNEVECIQRKRLLAFVNHFAGQTVDFISSFTSRVESRLQEVSLKIQKLEKEVALLERKLDSVPELRKSTPREAAAKSVTFQEPDQKDEESDETLKPFTKLLQAGATLEAVRKKMLASKIDVELVDAYLKRNS